MSAEPRAVHPVIRPLGPDDLDDVMAIEEAAYPFPWTREIFAGCLRVGYGCHALQVDGALAGYVIYNWGAGESHLLNLCVDPERQGQGLGARLLEYVIARVRELGCASMFLEVRPSNPGAARLYRRHGFREVGRRKDYYRAAGAREDAVIMRLVLEPAPGAAERS